MAARLSLLCVLALILSSLPSCRTVEPVFVAPKVDCGVYEPPKVQAPDDPQIGEKDVKVWQLFAYKWQQVADHILGQRVETAMCLHLLKQQGVIK